MMRLLNLFANVLTTQNQPSAPNTIEARLIGTIKIDFVTEVFYFEAQNLERYQISQKYAEEMCQHEAFFNEPVVECIVVKHNKINSYYSPKNSGYVKSVTPL